MIILINQYKYNLYLYKYNLNYSTNRSHHVDKPALTIFHTS